MVVPEPDVTTGHQSLTLVSPMPGDPTSPSFGGFIVHVQNTHRDAMILTVQSEASSELGLGVGVWFVVMSNARDTDD